MEGLSSGALLAARAHAAARRDQSIHSDDFSLSTLTYPRVEREKSAENRVQNPLLKNP